MNLIERVLCQPELVANPPVLVDVGASGTIHKEWRPFAKKSFCIAFDADTREMGHTVKEQAGFKRLYVYNCVLTDKPAPEVDFYLTRFPFCSSTLRPDGRSLDDWGFSPYFEVTQRLRLKASTLPAILAELRLTQVDWFKSDSQGMDMRLFQSLGEPLCRRVLAADFEPGIIDAYKGEDKLHALLSYMEEQPFFISRMTVKGSQRINRSYLAGYYNRLLLETLVGLTRPSPGWAEVSFLNTLEGSADKRALLLQIAFARAQDQFGFALELAIKGQHYYPSDCFTGLRRRIVARMLVGQLRQGCFSAALHLAKACVIERRYGKPETPVPGSDTA